MFHLMTKIIFSSQEDITHEICQNCQNCQNLNEDEMENLLETKYQSITNEFLKIIYVGIVQEHT